MHWLHPFWQGIFSFFQTPPPSRQPDCHSANPHFSNFASSLVFEKRKHCVALVIFLQFIQRDPAPPVTLRQSHFQTLVTANRKWLSTLRTRTSTVASPPSQATFMEDSRVININMYHKVICNFEFVDFKYPDRHLSQHILRTIFYFCKEAYVLFKSTHKSARTTCIHQLAVTT